MRFLLLALLPFGTFTQTTADAQQAPTVASQYRRVVSDYRALRHALSQPDLRNAAARLARDGYRVVIQSADDESSLSADDLFALGQCHEALGNVEQATARYEQSMADGPNARGKLALARLSADIDPDVAEGYFLEADSLDPQDPRLGPFRLLLGAAYQRERQWLKAIEHLEAYEKYVSALAEQNPNDLSRFAKREATQIRLHDLAIYRDLEGNPAPAWMLREPIEGEPIPLADLRGHVVLLDFFATWAEPSQARMAELQQIVALHSGQPLQVVGLAVPADGGIPAAYESALSTARSYARRADISWPLAYTERATAEQYGVSTVPHTVVIDKRGVVRLIVQASTDRNIRDLRNLVADLLQ